MRKLFYALLVSVALLPLACEDWFSFQNIPWGELVPQYPQFPGDGDDDEGCPIVVPTPTPDSSPEGTPVPTPTPEGGDGDGESEPTPTPTPTPYDEEGLSEEGQACLDEGKGWVCHIPRGNTANYFNVCVATQAVDAHLAHNDYFGDCEEYPD